MRANKSCFINCKKDLQLEIFPPSGSPERLNWICIYLPYTVETQISLFHQQPMSKTDMPTNREELLLRTVLAFPNASRRGLLSKRTSLTRITSGEFPDTAAMYLYSRNGINYCTEIQLRNVLQNFLCRLSLSCPRLAGNDDTLIFTFVHHLTIHVIRNSIYVRWKLIEV